MGSKPQGHRCQKCNKSYKTSSSLASHRSRAHPYVSSLSSSNSEMEKSDDERSITLKTSLIHDPHITDTHDVSIKNLQAAIYQLRELYEEMEWTISKHEKALRQIQTHKIDNEEMNAITSTQRDKLSDRFSGSENEVVTDMDSDSASVYDNPRSKDKNTNSARKKFYGL